VDTTAQVFNEMSLIGRYLRILLAEGGYDAITLFLTPVAASGDVARRLIAELKEALGPHPGIPMVISLAATPELTEPYEKAGYPVFSEPTRAVRAVGLLCRLAESRRRVDSSPVGDPPVGAPRVPHRLLGNQEAMQILGGWGIPCDPDDRRSGVDVAVGIRKDPTFGPAVTVGLVGVPFEVFDDVAYRLAPFSVQEADKMIAELRGARLLRESDSHRGLDIAALAKLLSAVSVFAAAEMDAMSSARLGPVRVLPEGQGCVVLDAVIETESG
jgi:hypothetical protein